MLLNVKRVELSKKLTEIIENNNQLRLLILGLKSEPSEHLPATRLKITNGNLAIELHNDDPMEMPAGIAHRVTPALLMEVVLDHMLSDGLNLEKEICTQLLEDHQDQP